MSLLAFFEESLSRLWVKSVRVLSTLLGSREKGGGEREVFTQGFFKRLQFLANQFE